MSRPLDASMDPPAINAADDRYAHDVTIMKAAGWDRPADAGIDPCDRYQEAADKPRQHGRGQAISP